MYTSQLEYIVPCQYEDYFERKHIDREFIRHTILECSIELTLIIN